MASGIGVNGGSGRCYPLWLDFTKCLSDAEKPMDCKLFRDDYLECLHHFKEFRRLKTVQQEAERQRVAKEAADKEAIAAAKIAAANAVSNSS